MLALKQGENVIAQVEANGKGTHPTYKFKAKGTLYEE